MFTTTRFTILTAVAASLTVGHLAAQALDFATFRTKVEPIFNKKREGHARCVVCHSGTNRVFRLEPLAPGTTSWTEEQSRKNFEVVSKLVKPGDAMGSLLLKQPLAPEAGGNDFHSGGRQFASQNDPDWKTIADWVRGAQSK